MTHKEFKLVVTKEILEVGTGYSVKAVHYGVGYNLTVDEDTFIKLKDGEDIEQYTNDGYIKFNKYNFENEVEVIMVTIEYDVKKLGNKK